MDENLIRKVIIQTNVGYCKLKLYCKMSDCLKQDRISVLLK